MRITKEQSELLNRFQCERLSANESNKELLDSFTSHRGSSLVAYFQTQGWDEDQNGVTAYYVVKNEENDILMFFSLKCGALFEPLMDEAEVKQDVQRLLVLLQAIENEQGDNKDIEVDKVAVNMIAAGTLATSIERHQVGNRRICAYINLLLQSKVEKKKKFLIPLFGDKEQEKNENIIRVQKNYPAVELVHFCTNDNMREKWQTYGFGHSMGETLFWKFITPKFFAVQEIVGCEYVFLFAADLSEDSSLVNYYDVSLKFQQRQDVGTNKPFYDFCCDFMCQEVNEMKCNRKLFFDNFNVNEDDQIV
jgi:hypothetical protein